VSVASSERWKGGKVVDCHQHAQGYRAATTHVFWVVDQDSKTGFLVQRRQPLLERFGIVDVRYSDEHDVSGFEKGNGQDPEYGRHGRWRENDFG